MHSSNGPLAPLFVKAPELQFEKSAAKIRLEGSFDQLEQELLQLAYKKHPYLGKYNIKVNIEEKDDVRGYAKGFFVVSLREDAIEGDTPGAGGLFHPSKPAAPDRTVTIPIIVDSGKVFSFDVMNLPKDMKFVPLSEVRLLQHLPDPRQMKLVSNAQAAPARAGGIEGGGAGGFPDSPEEAYAGGRGYGRFGGFGGLVEKVGHFKVAKADADAYLRTISSPEFRSSTASFKDANAQLVPALQNIQQEKTAAAEAHSAVEAPKCPFVLSKTPGGFLIKTASAEFRIGNVEAEGVLAKEARALCLSMGPILLTPGRSSALETTDVGTAEFDKIAEAGMYKVATAAGIEDAILFTERRHLDIQGSLPGNDPLLLAGSGYMFGPSAQGEKLAGLDLEYYSFDGRIEGLGVFLLDKEAGAITQPLLVKHAASIQGREALLVEDAATGNPATLFLEDAKSPIKVNGTTFLFPKTAQFIPLPNTTITYLADNPGRHKLAARKDVVVLSHDAGNYRLQNYFSGEGDGCLYTAEEALLKLASMGDSSVGAHQKLARAKFEDVAIIHGEYSAENLEEKLAAVKFVDDYESLLEKTASEIRIDLVKEAAALNTNRDTVDSVLSLGFVTKENVDKYIGFISDFEEALEKLCDLLIAVRLGLDPTLETPVLSAINGMERAIIGLKRLDAERSIAPAQNMNTGE